MSRIKLQSAVLPHFSSDEVRLRDYERDREISTSTQYSKREREREREIADTIHIEIEQKSTLGESTSRYHHQQNQVYKSVESVVGKMAADSGMETCPSPEIPDSRKRPLDCDADNGSTKRSHYGTG